MLNCIYCGGVIETDLDGYLVHTCPKNKVKAVTPTTDGWEPPEEGEKGSLLWKFICLLFNRR